MTSKVLILDFGSQYTQLIARRVREQKIYCEILPCNAPFSKIKDFKPAALILSGGPSSVYDKDAPEAAREIFTLGVPILGICYGMQWLSKVLGGEVAPGKIREYGPAKIAITESQALFKNLGSAETTVWMS